MLIIVMVGGVVPDAVGQRMHDLDGDGVAEVLPPGTVVADFNRDGLLEMVKYDGRRLIFYRGPDDVEQVIELSGAIQGLDALDIDHDGKLDLRATLASGKTVELTRLSTILPASWAVVPTSNTLGDTAQTQACACKPIDEAWNSGNDLNLVWTVAAGNFDGDGKSDILTVNWPKPEMRVYENDGDNSFSLVFSTPESDAPPGAFVTVTGGDTDQDGQGELIGAETSTLNQVFLYEAVGDNTYVKRDVNISEPDFNGQKGPSKILVADTDQDGKKEIIFDTSSSTGAGSIVFVYEHSGNVGENVYTKVFEHSTVSFLFNLAVGDSDNDGNQEIIMAFGGFGGSPVNLRRLENTGDNTYQHKITQPGGIGLALGPIVGDFDLDGENELAFGGVVGNQGGGIFIYKAIADDTYELVFSQGGLNGNGIASAAGILHCGSQPVIAVGTSVRELDIWKFNGQNYMRALDAPITSSGQNRSIVISQLDGDNNGDLLFSSIGSDDRIYVYESRQPSADFDDDGDVDLTDYANFFQCFAGPNQPPAQTCPKGVNADLDSDVDVDLADFDLFQLAFTAG